MLFLYGELIVLLLVSFAVGATVAAVVTRALVKPLPPELAGGPAERGDVNAATGVGGTP